MRDLLHSSGRAKPSNVMVMSWALFGWVVNSSNTTWREEPGGTGKHTKVIQLATRVIALGWGLSDSRVLLRVGSGSCVALVSSVLGARYLDSPRLQRALTHPCHNPNASIHIQSQSAQLETALRQTGPPREMSATTKKYKHQGRKTSQGFQYLAHTRRGWDRETPVKF